MHLLLLSLELLLVRQILPFASTTNTKVLTWRNYACVAIFMYLHNLSLAIAFALLGDLQVDYIATQKGANTTMSSILTRHLPSAATSVIVTFSYNGSGFFFLAMFFLYIIIGVQS